MKTDKVRMLKELAVDIVVDVIASILIAVGIYNFALNADFPVAGFSGLAIVMYHLFKIPVGIGTLILNIPVAIFCYKFLGKRFFYVSIKSMVISSFFMDYVAPYFPTYHGDRLLAAICMSVCCGVGFAMIFMRGSSTGGQDFLTMSIKKIRPHLAIGTITFVLDISTILLGYVLVFKDVDGLIYGIIVTFLQAVVLDKIIYGIDEGKMTLIVTERAEEICEKINEYSGRGATILQGVGSFSKREKQVVLCACNNKQMYTIKKLAHEADPQSFIMIMESNEVIGEGFKEQVSGL